MTSIVVQTLEFVQINPYDDEGTHYLFQLADEYVLSFGGQDFSPTKKWPSDHFEIVLAFGQKDEIVMQEIYNHGNKLKPIRSYKGKSTWETIFRPDYPNPEDYTMVKGRLSDFDGRFSTRE